MVVSEIFIVQITDILEKTTTSIKNKCLLSNKCIFSYHNY